MRDYTKKDLEELREYYNEHERTQASKRIRRNYDKMNDSFNNYLDAVQEEEWNEGFLYAVKLAKEGALL